MNGGCHAAFIYAANCINLGSDLRHMVEVLKIAYGTSWKSMTTSCKKNGQEVGPNKFKISGWICMP